MTQAQPETKEAPKAATRDYLFPELGVTVQASSLEEAQAKVAAKGKDGDR